MPALLTRVVAWLREGYPTGVPDQDYIPLLALLRRRLTDDEVLSVAHELSRAGMVSPARADIGASILAITDTTPYDLDIVRVQERLAFRGWPTA